MSRHLEDNLQSSCIKWFDLQYKGEDKLLFAVPNGGKRNKLEAVRLKKQGVRAGVSDLILLCNGDTLFIELKIKGGRQSGEQKKFQEAVVYEGFEYVIVKSLDEFIKEVTSFINYRDKEY